MRQIWGGILAATGFVVCPCHLPLTLPFLLGVLGGTGIGGFIAANTGLVYGLATGYFVLGFGAGLFLLNRKNSSRGRAGRLPEPMEQKTTEEEYIMANVQQLELTVQDNAIHCGGCESRIETVLKKLPGVVKVKADHRTQKISITRDIDRLSVHEAREKLRAIGFETGGSKERHR